MFRVQIDDPYNNVISELVEVRLIEISVTVTDNRTGEMMDFVLCYSVDKSATDDQIIDDAKTLVHHMGFTYGGRGDWKEKIVSFDALYKFIKSREEE